MTELKSQLKQYAFVRKKYEESANEKCIPNLHYITWCIELGKENCPKTCYYAIEKLKGKDKNDRKI